MGSRGRDRNNRSAEGEGRGLDGNLLTGFNGFNGRWRRGAVPDTATREGGVLPSGHSSGMQVSTARLMKSFCIFESFHMLFPPNFCI